MEKTVNCSNAYAGKEKVGKDSRALTLATREWNIVAVATADHTCSSSCCWRLTIQPKKSVSSLTSRATSPQAEDRELGVSGF